MRNFFLNYKKNAFTIIELSVALVVITSFLIATMGVFKVTSEFYKVRENQKRLQAVKIGLNAYFARNGRLPYPADPTLAFNNVDFGKEQPSLSGRALQNQGGTSGIKSHILLGAVPVAELGLDNSYIFDAYGYQIEYIVHSHIAMNNDDNTIPDLDGYKKNMYTTKKSQPCNKNTSTCPIDNFYATKLVKDSNDDKFLFPYNLEIKDNRTNQTISGTKNKIAYAIISHGANGSCAYTKSGNVSAVPTNSEKYNCSSYWLSGSNYLYSTSTTGTDAPITLYTGIKNDSFDDLIVWQTLENIFVYGLEIDRYAVLGNSNQGSGSLWSFLDPTSDGGHGIFFFDQSYPNSNVVIGDKNNYKSLTNNANISGNLNDKFTVIGGSARFLSSQGTIFRYTDDTTISNINEFAIEPTVEGALNIQYRTRDSNDNINALSLLTIAQFANTQSTFKNIKITNSNASYYPLEVNATILSNTSSGEMSISQNGSLIENVQCIGNPLPISCQEPVSIYASGRILSKAITLFSDSRAKKDISKSDSLKDLEILKKINISDYKFIDSHKQEKKVIAQELEKIYPQAVQKSRGTIPNVISFANFQKINDLIIITFDTKHAIKENDILEILCQDLKFNAKIISVNKNNITINSENFPCGKNEKLYIYGTVVDDFRAVDYDAISMLNVSATQELINKIEKIEQELSKTKNYLNSTKDYVESGILQWQFILLFLFIILSIFSIYQFIELKKIKSQNK